MSVIEATAFTAGSVARAAERRTDDVWLAAARADPTSRVLLVRGADVETGDDGGLHLRPDGAPDGSVLLGLVDGAAWFAAPSPPPPSAPDHDAGLDGPTFVPLRELAADLEPAAALLAATAVGLVGWHERSGWCPRCGSPTQPVQAGHVRRCEGCETLHFPRTDPAVIMHVTAGDRCVLGRRIGSPPNRWSTMAGFVEVGESLEHAVAREVAEETGLIVTSTAYEQSQPWPFPCSLMIGFQTEVGPGELRGDGEHLELRWFERGELAAAVAAGTVELPPPLAIGRTLIQRWLHAPR